MRKNTNKFIYNVWLWDFNHDELDAYDVVPRFLDALKRLPKSEKPKTKEDLDKFLDSEASYNFWSKCEYEMVIHGWPKGKNDKKVDAYEQLKLNWNVFVDMFWENWNKSKRRK